MAVGFTFAAVVFKTGILRPAMIAQLLINFTAVFGRPDFSPVWNAALGVGITIIFGSYGIFVVRKNGMRSDDDDGMPIVTASA